MAMVHVSPKQYCHECRQHHQAQEGVAVFVIEENGLAVMASVHQMVTSFFGPLVAAWHAPPGATPVQAGEEFGSSGPPILFTTPISQSSFLQRHLFLTLPLL